MRRKGNRLHFQIILVTWRTKKLPTMKLQRLQPAGDIDGVWLF